MPLPERALAKTLRRCLGKQYITISDVKPHLTSTCRSQEHYCAVFDLAAQLQVGVPEGTYPGTRGAPYRLRLTFASMMPATRQRLGLEAGMGDVDPLPLPPIRGGGKRPASAGAKKQGQPRIAPAPARQAEGQQAAEQGERQQGPRPGRPRGSGQEIYTVESIAHIEAGFDSRDVFLKAQQDWAATTKPGKHLAIRYQWYDYKKGFKVLLWCNSCAICKIKKGWRGYCAYDANTHQLTRAFTPQSLHGDCDAPIGSWSPLTSTTEAKLKEHLTHNARSSVQELLKIAEENQKETVRSPEGLLEALEGKPTKIDSKAP